MNVARPHPAGSLQFASSANRAHLSRLAKSGRAARLAAGIYVVGGTLPSEALARQHSLAIAAEVWPAAVLCDRSGFAGPVPVDGWLYLCQPDLSRISDLRLPSLTISPRPGSGPC